MQKKIYCPDIECESCVKIITKAFERLQGIEKFEVGKTAIDVTFNESLIKEENIIATIKEKGYRASLDPYTRKQIRERTKEFLTDKKKYAVEHLILEQITLTFFILIMIDITFFYFKNQIDPTFFGKYAWWIFYLSLAIVTITGAIWHFKAYRTQYTSMVGMMIGMTLGMQTGMMIGAILGATNGFFTGALVGMILASAVGAYCGSCCGIMGIMEGIMAGMMGGTMGAMISVMMFYQHILWFMPAFMILNIIILIGLSYMIFEEVVEENNQIIKEPMSFKQYLMLCLVSLFVLLSIIFLTPASTFLA